ncbi:hypothetical protein [Variovorax sp. CCNWLW225]|jgi:hypothetical protein|uniref:hypothetical protein n=1 Tax=Variovorax sp. CCNWLW225 TaxID=3127462 RepID=UPI003076BF1B
MNTDGQVNTIFKLSLRIVVWTLWPILTTAAAAQPTVSTERSDAVAAACLSSAKQTLADPDLQPILRTAMATPEGVCSCTDAMMKADQLLQLALSNDDEASSKVMPRKDWGIYVRGKFSAYLMQCLGETIGRATDKLYSERRR